MNETPVITDLYQSGFSLREVAAILGVDRKLVKRRLEAQGVEIRPPNSVKRSGWLDRAMTIHYGQKWLAVFRPFGGGVALTLGSHVFYHGDPPIPTRTLAHEMVHVGQWAEMGYVRFLAVYLWELVKLRGKPIWEHPLEKPAYEGGQDA